MSMTPKGFLAKTQTKAAISAQAFLNQYREYLTTGEVASKTAPILAKLDSGKILPTPALNEIQNAVLSHILEVDSAKLNKATKPAASANKKWRATIYNEAGVIQSRVKENGEEEDLVKGFDLAQDADRWCDRRLFEGLNGWYAVVEHASIPGISSRIERGDAIARVMKKPKGPTIAVKGKSTKTLGFGVKVKESRCSFSSG